MHKLILWHAVHSHFAFIHGGRGGGLFLLVILAGAALGIIMAATMDKSK
jgi:hypothetical protein